MQLPKITIGYTADGTPVVVDLEVLISTRMLVSANSGGGKSYLLRLLAEQIHTHMPVIIFDPEGEFASLRDKFPFVLVGPDGETPADCRSAHLVMQRLLENRASAIIDLSELSLKDRHRYMRLSCESAIGSSKELWRPTCFIFDEVHEVCPSNGKGDSEAKAAVLAFPTKGRKRRFLPIFATQRLHKLDLDARAEMLNRMIGMTFEPDDLKVSASILGVGGKDVNEFNHEMRTMEPGNFFVFGRAICKEKKLFKVSPVQTRHEVKVSKHVRSAPPTPEAIKKLLPMLSDLPQQAEEQLQTVAEFKAKVSALNKTIVELKRVQPKQEPAKVKIEKQQVFTKADRARLAKLVLVFDRTMADAKKTAEAAYEAVRGLNGLSFIPKGVEAELQFLKTQLTSISQMSEIAAKAVVVPTVATPTTRWWPGTESGNPISAKVVVREVRTTLDDSSEKKLGACAQKMLAVLASYPDGCEIGKLALLSGYRISGNLKNNLADLRGRGFISGDNTGTMTITQEGLEQGPFDPMPVGEAFRSYWMTHTSFGVCERAIMKALLVNPQGLGIDDLAANSIQESGTPYLVSGNFKNALSALRTAGLLIGRNTEPMRLTDEFFTE